MEELGRYTRYFRTCVKLILSLDSKKNIYVNLEGKKDVIGNELEVCLT